jgi:hypothetical protein
MALLAQQRADATRREAVEAERQALAAQQQARLSQQDALASQQQARAAEARAALLESELRDLAAIKTDRGMVVTQHTQFPERETTRLTIDRADAHRSASATILVRHPSWCDGQTISVNGRSFVVIGVTDKFRGWGRATRVGETDVWLPIGTQQATMRASSGMAFPSGRVREGERTLTSRPSAAWIDSDGGVSWLECVSR